MSEETHEVAEQEEIFDTDQTEVADDATDTSTQQEDEIFEPSGETEQKQEDLDLSDKVPSKAEEKKLAIIKALQAKLDDGSLTLNKLPQAQSWAKKYLKEAGSGLEVDHKAIAKELAREAIREERAELQYLDLKDSLNAARLTKEQKETIVEKYKKYILKGFSKFEALAEATEYARVDFTGLAEKKRRMSIPMPSTKKSSGDIDESSMTFQDIVENYPPEKVNEYLRKQLKR